MVQTSKNLKILFKMWKFPRTSETFILAQMATAVKAGYAVDLLIGDRSGIENNIHAEMVDGYGLKENVIIEDYQIPKKKFLRWIKAGIFVLGNLRHLRKIINLLEKENFQRIDSVYHYFFYKKINGYDIIHVQYGTNTKPLDLLKEIGLIKSKIIVSFHGHDAFFPINNRIPNNGYYQKLFEYGDIMVANTPYLATQLKILGCPTEKIKTIPVAVSIAFFYPKRPVENSYLSFKLIIVGRLDKVKGHSHAIEVLQVLRKKGYSVNLTIVGEGYERGNIEQMIAEKDMQDYIILLGEKNQMEIRSLLQEHDIYILPSVAVENNRRETQGLATLEAQACGLPVVAFDSGGVKYTIEDGASGYLVKEGDTIEMTKKIEELIKNPSLREVMSKAAITFVEEKFSQRRIDEYWEREYSKLIELNDSESFSNNTLL